MNEKELENLKKENDRLEYDLISKQNIYIKQLENRIKMLDKKIEELEATNNVLSSELTKDKVIKQDYLTSCCGIPISDIPEILIKYKEIIGVEDEEINVL